MSQNLADPDGQSSQVFLPHLCKLSSQLSQSLGTAGTSAEGQMGYRQSPLHPDASLGLNTADLTGTGSKEWNLVRLLPLLSSRLHQLAGKVSVKACSTLVIYTDTDTPEQNREIVSSRCATVATQSFFGVSSPNKSNPASRPLGSAAHRARLLFAHKVRDEVKLVLSEEELGQLLNAVQPKLQHQGSQNLLVDQIHVHAVLHQWAANVLHAR